MALYVDDPQPYRYLSSALGHLGRIRQAREALQYWQEAFPESFDRYTRERPYWLRPEDHQHMLSGLRKAGWQG